MNRIYLDNAATTPMTEVVIDAMVDAMKGSYGNPSSTHSLGQQAKTILEETRRLIAEYLHVQPAEIIFTSCGTEANNLIIKSCVRDLGVTRIITSALEHKCVAECCREMKKLGAELVYLKPDSDGNFDLSKLEDLLKTDDKKTLVSLMHANNEIGNYTDIRKVGELCRKYGALFHSDTVQTVAHIPLDFSDVQVDFASCSAHKFHGPKGIGFAFIRKSSRLKPQISGGGQERGLRAGTENVCGIAGLQKALQESIDHMAEYTAQIQELKDYAIARLQEKVPGVRFNGLSADRDKSLYTLLSVLLPFKDPLIGLKLDIKGIAVSQGSACSSGAAQPSMVMMSILDDDTMERTTPLRVSFSHLNTKEDVDALCDALVEIEKTIEKANA